MGAIPGIEFNTFSIIGRCSRTGMLGVAITTSDITVGSRCPYVMPSVGAISTQASTDPGLGPFALRLMEQGYPAKGALQQLEANDPFIERRQLGMVDHNGNSAARTGAMNNPWAGHIAGRDHVAMGNGLVGEGVVQAMSSVFLDAADLDLEERLTRTLEAGQEAGGEAQDATPHHSAALLVYASDTFSRVDLRVDEHPTPVVELRRLLDIFAPKIDYFALRANDPEAAQAAKDVAV
ncbi:MAG: DUF1028 domain-containing protein [Dehalococcoidia bacterium]|nr:DUF1028 domain-containing protein [Dehalococcoidia bacterium]|tara:strand:+ start:2648 stop:3355 length:708 start_codon:yes stop_codon:yes gene_type:complete